MCPTRPIYPPSPPFWYSVRSMSLPDSSAVAEQLAAFERELAAAPTTRDAQAVRDRFLGRKNSVVASWMASIASAPVDQKKLIGKYANELKQQVETR